MARCVASEAEAEAPTPKPIRTKDYLDALRAACDGDVAAVVAADPGFAGRVLATLMDERGIISGPRREWTVMAMRRVVSTHVACLRLHSSPDLRCLCWRGAQSVLQRAV